MIAAGLLLDEHVDPRLGSAVRRVNPLVRVHILGLEEAPPRGTPDPTLLRWIETNECVLVTRDRTSLPHHLRDHLSTGHHVPGIVILPRRLHLWGPLVDDLLLLWEAGQPGELRDQIIYLPL